MGAALALEEDAHWAPVKNPVWSFHLQGWVSRGSAAGLKLGLEQKDSGKPGRIRFAVKLS